MLIGKGERSIRPALFEYLGLKALFVKNSEKDGFDLNLSRFLSFIDVSSDKQNDKNRAGPEDYPDSVLCLKSTLNVYHMIGFSPPPPHLSLYRSAKEISPF